MSGITTTKASAPHENNKCKSRRRSGRSKDHQKVVPKTRNVEDTTKENMIESPSTELSEHDAFCLICTEPVQYYSVSECNHRTCHVCALRLRALYKRKNCTFCKHDQATLIFTRSPDRDFESFKPDEIPFKDAKLSFHFETQDMMEESLILLRFNCPDSACDFIAHGWGDLKMHVRGIHGKSMCDMCIRHKKVFAHEHILYQPSQLPLHLPSISHRGLPRDQGQKVEGGVHPLCEFCKECYFGDDELFAHMRERHEECFICKRDGIRDQYFKDYLSLEQHFNVSHYPCKDSQCQAQKFVVFGSSLDLKAHLVEQHGKNMTARDRRDARRLENAFEYEGRDTGDPTRTRLRAREEEPPPVPTPPNRSGRRDAFGSSLTGSSTTPAETPARIPTPSATDAQVDPETTERHVAFLARLDALTPNATNAVPAVRAAIRSFRASESNARDVISTIFEVINHDLDNTARLISSLVELLDDEEKRRALLSAWNAFKIEQRQDFPELTPVAPGSEYAGVAGGRILNAKNSSSVRSSSSQSQRQIWDRVAQAAASIQPLRQQRFPTLTASKDVPAYRQVPRTTAWSGAGASTSSAPATSSINPQGVTRARSDGGRAGGPIYISQAQFPSLPSASSSKEKPQFRGNQSLKNILGESAPKGPSRWGGRGEGIAGGVTEENQPESGTGSKGKKKKGKEKQTLFTFGTFPT